MPARARLGTTATTIPALQRRPIASPDESISPPGRISHPTLSNSPGGEVLRGLGCVQCLVVERHLVEAAFAEQRAAVARHEVERRVGEAAAAEAARAFAERDR